MALRETPSQTAGPYVHIGTLPAVAGINAPGYDLGSTMRREGARGEFGGPRRWRRERAMLWTAARWWGGIVQTAGNAPLPVPLSEVKPGQAL